MPKKKPIKKKPTTVKAKTKKLPNKTKVKTKPKPSSLQKGKGSKGKPKAKVTKADVKAAKEAVKKQWADKPIPKTPAEALLQEPTYKDSTIYHYLLAHKLALISDMEGISPKDVIEDKELVLKFKLPKEVSELDIRKAEEICSEWTRTIKAMKHG
jgi:hypothetical protein